MNRNLLLLGACLAYAAPLFAAAPPPTDASAPTPRATYRSAFEGYRAFREEPIADWRSLNDEVGRAGGHVGIFGGASGHAGQGGAKPAQGKPMATKPAEPASAAGGGQPPVRNTPKAPAAAAHH